MTLKIKNEVLKRGKYKNSDIEKMLSKGALENTNEFFAQAFSEYIDSNKPRKLAKIFGIYLFELLSTI